MKLRLTCDGPTGRSGHVWLDDKELHGITHVSIAVGVDGRNEAIIALLPEFIDVDMDALIRWQNANEPDAAQLLLHAATPTPKL